MWCTASDPTELVAEWLLLMRACAVCACATLGQSRLEFVADFVLVELGHVEFFIPRLEQLEIANQSAHFDVREASQLGDARARRRLACARTRTHTHRQAAAARSVRCDDRPSCALSMLLLLR